MNLKDFIKKYFTYYGEYTLSSGKKSNLYFDIKGLMLNHDGARRVGKEFEKLLPNKEPHYFLTGMELGGALLTQIMIYRGFAGVVVRKQRKDYGMGKRIEGFMTRYPYIIIDDVITTGNSVNEVKNLLAPYDGKLLGIYCIIDRSEEGKYLSLFKEKDFE